jgi:hypothetical protein
MFGVISTDHAYLRHALIAFYVPSERLVGRKNNIIQFRSIGTIGESGVLLVVNFVGKLKLERVGVC